MSGRKRQRRPRIKSSSMGQAQLSLTRFIRSGSTNIIASLLRFRSTINRLARVGEFDRSSRAPSISERPTVMTDEQLKQAKTKILHFPTVLGAVVPAYNVPGVTQEINFTPEALAGIFLGKITKWSDPEFKKANAGVNLPDKNIVVIHRSDGSGTTYVWVDYLSKVSPEWKSKVGVNTSVNWPVGLGGKGNEGVAGLIKQTPNSIGYVELIYRS